MSSTLTTATRDAFTPTGKLRASINLGNPILAHADEAGHPQGVSVDLANALANLLCVELDLIVFDTAAKSVEAVATEQADIGFFAIDPIRGAEITFTAPYVLIEGFYLVKQDSPLVTNAQVDAANNRIVVGKGSAYDLFLTRELKQASIIRAPSSPTVVATFLTENADVAAGVKQQLEADATKIGGLRLLDHRFMVIQQAMGLPKSRNAGAAIFLRQFVEQMKLSGFVATALEHHKVKGASVAEAG